MAIVGVTAEQVGRVFPTEDEVFTVIADESVTAGQVLYQTAGGRFGLADANAAGRGQARGVALNAAGAGQPVLLLKRGAVEGFDVSALNADVPVYLSDTAGAVDDTASSTLAVILGRVLVVNGRKVVHFDCDWLRTWS